MSRMSDDKVLALIARVRRTPHNADVAVVCDQLERRINKPKQAIEHLTGGKFRGNVKFDNKRYQRHLLRSPSERMRELGKALSFPLSIPKSFR